MIQFSNVSKRYASGQEALKNLSFSLERGEMAFLTGHSGAGKSTVLKLISLIERPTAGQFLLSDKDVTRLSSRQVPYVRRQMGVVFQNHRLLSDRTVFDNVALPLSIAGYPPKEAAKKVRAALDKVGLLSKEKMRPIMLSGGEQQRVGIARAMVNKPSLLLADEPTGNLDPDLSADIMNLFAEFNRVGVTVLVASHDLALIAKLRYRMLTLRDGQLVGGR
ncbi:MAG: cell division ATP-binding protein FtsE [Kangiellaceae bacterium]|nr:cell division ATP-binding protein FtsE [Kangiellaceae bacterium]|tara:strand:+ start:323 stop:982 length:660 start_codon:yes stop_codon:yes gene_type:complete